MIIRRQHLRKAVPANLFRLASFLKLHTNGMSHRQIVNLVYWRITRNKMNHH